MTDTVYRWQDADGRGPYKPGLSHYWKDANHEVRNPPFYDEFGWAVLTQCGKHENMGCAFRTPDQMLRWFTQAERDRMRLLGYEFGALAVDRILAESERQLVFARRVPLRRGFTTLALEAA